MSSVYRDSDPRPRGRTFLLQMTDAVYLMKLINVTKCHGKFPRDTFASWRAEAYAKLMLKEIIEVQL